MLYNFFRQENAESIPDFAKLGFHAFYYNARYNLCG
jgi:hypothetical protein